MTTFNSPKTKKNISDLIWYTRSSEKSSVRPGGEAPCHYKTSSALRATREYPGPVPRLAGMWCHDQQRDGGWGSRWRQLSACCERTSEQMKLPQTLFSYTKNLMTGFLVGHSGPAGEAISKLAQVCVVWENMVHGRGQSLALSWQLLKIRFHQRTHSTHLCWSLLWWHRKTPCSSLSDCYRI